MTQRLNADFSLSYCLFIAFKLTKNADQEKHSYLGYSIGFSSLSHFWYSNFYYGENVIIFGLDNSSLVQFW